MKCKTETCTLQTFSSKGHASPPYQQGMLIELIIKSFLIGSAAAMDWEREY